jgi:hypothetical protein
LLSPQFSCFSYFTERERKMGVSVIIDLEKREYIDDYLENAINEAIIQASYRIEAELTNLIPIESGELRDSFRAVPTSTGINLIWSAPHASVVDAGSPPHMIYPSGKALKFNAFGKTVFAKSVKHPGQQPQNFTTIIGQRALVILNEELAKALTTYSAMVS